MSRSPLICVYITINIRFKDFPGPFASASYKNLDKVFNNAIKIVLDIVHWNTVDMFWSGPAGTDPWPLFFFHKIPNFPGLLYSSRPTSFLRKLSRIPRKPHSLRKYDGRARPLDRRGKCSEVARMKRRHKNVRLSTPPAIFTTKVNIWLSRWPGNLFSSYIIHPPKVWRCSLIT